MLKLAIKNAPLTALHDKRHWVDIQKDKGYWQRFHRTLQRRSNNDRPLNLKVMGIRERAAA